MDLLSILGILVGVLAVIAGNFLEGGELDSLINGPAFIIVLGGTLGATLLQTPFAVFIHACRRMLWVLVPPAMNRSRLIAKVVEWSIVARRDGPLAIERLVDQESDDFARRGLQLLADAAQPKQLRDCLELDMNAREDMDVQAAMVFEAMGGYAPTLGILGAVMGLIQVMQHLSDPALLGNGIAVAFVSTIYGIGLANLLFIPAAQKIRAQARELQQTREMLLEGFVDISLGQSPRNTEFKLSAYLKS